MPYRVKRDILLFLWKVTPEHIGSVKSANKMLKKKYRIFLLTYPKYEIPESVAKEIDGVIRTNLRNMAQVEKKLAPYYDQIAAILNRWESTMPLYGRLFELFPYLKGPSLRSMRLASNKMEMRKAFLRYDKKISPSFMVVKRLSDRTLKEIKEKIGFPCVIKPVSLSLSRFISINYYEDELKANLEKAMKRLEATFRQNKVEHEPRLIVEEFMEGQMYSVDAYVNDTGRVTFTPMVDVKTGREVGYDDVFTYLQITPSQVTTVEAEAAREVCRKGIYALGLRNSSAHIELMRTVKGWKIVEIGARVGGFRNEIYRLAFDFDHKANDILVHLGRRPVIKRMPKYHVAILKFYPKKPGKLVSIGGLQKAKELSSVVSVYQEKSVGDYCDFAKHGHLFVVAFVIRAKTRADLLGEVRKIEHLINIETEKAGANTSEKKEEKNAKRERNTGKKKEEKK